MRADFSEFFRKCMKKKGLSIKKTAELSGISRQNLHKILNGDVSQARLTTFVKLSYAVNEHPLHLFRIFLDSSGLSLKDSSFRTVSSEFGDDIGFIGDITYPDNSLVNANQCFDKTWEVQNIGKVTWQGRKLICLDDDLQSSHTTTTGLKPKFRMMELPIVEPDEHLTITIPFTAPSYPCTVISHWKMTDNLGRTCFPKNHPLSCCVKVVSF